MQRSCFAAQLAREALETNWLKLEIHPDPKYLMMHRNAESDRGIN
jgi:thiazole synthase ThiGH ThiG subunit